MASTLKIPCVDLFSGIGGISLALRGVCETMLYCEADKYCQQVLVERMREGRLERAPIHPDVKTLCLGVLKPRLLVGGFPCQDISSIGLQRGIGEGEKSGLFYEIVRLLDECESIEYAFLENVGNILKCGMREVVEELGVKRGWSLRWILKSAGAVGAPHQRTRWFCLAARPGAQGLLCDENQGELGDEVALCSWDQEPGVRVSVRPGNGVEDATYDENWIHRWHCLGNTVVPEVVRDAFFELARSEKYWGVVSEAFAKCGVDAAGLDYPFCESGLVISGRFFALPVASGDGGNVRRGGGVSATLKNGDGETFVIKSYPTPRRGNSHAAVITERSLRDLPTILVHCEESKKYLRDLGVECEEGMTHKKTIPSINYVEWMMGYESDWTRVSGFGNGGPSRGRRVRDVESEDGGEEEEKNEAVAVGKKRTRSVRTRRSGTSTNLKTKGLNGMHVFMKANPGKDVKEVAKLWKGLSAEERGVYSARAKELK